MISHWQPKDYKENMADDIREWVQRYDPTAKLESLTRLTALDLTVLMLVLRGADKEQEERNVPRSDHQS